MGDPSEPSGPTAEGREGDEAGSANADVVAGDAAGPDDPETVRQAVEEKYDFERFSPADMAEMTVEEWEAAFDADTWITGPALLDRVEADLRSQVDRRELFAVVERTTLDGVEHVMAYTDVGYALVGPDGTVRGEGPIVEEVEPVVALCSMDDYDPPEAPVDGGLPDPDEIGAGTGGLGDRLLLTVAGIQVLAGVGLLVSPLFVDLDPAGGAGGGALVTTVAGLGFLVVGVVIGLLVANARLSGRFRAAEYRERLRAAGVGSDERPSFLPDEGGGESGAATADESAEPAPD